MKDGLICCLANVTPIIQVRLQHMVIVSVHVHAQVCVVNTLASKDLL